MILRAYLGVLLTVVFWGANVVAAKLLLADFTPGEVIAGRLGVAGAVLLGLCLLRSGWPRWPWRTWLRVGLVGLLGNAVFQTLFLEGIARAPAGVAGLTNAVVPVVVVLLGALLGQRPTARQGLGAGVSLAGMVLLFALTRAPGTALNPLGLGLLLLAAVVWAVYTLANRSLSEQVGLLPFVAFSLVLGSLPYLALDLPSVLTAHAPLGAWALLVLSALAANVFAYLAWANGARLLGAARTSIWQNLAPLVALVLAALLLGERLSGAVLLASGVILAGVLLTNWPVRNANKAGPQRGPAGDFSSAD